MVFVIELVAGSFFQLNDHNDHKQCFETVCVLAFVGQGHFSCAVSRSIEVGAFSSWSCFAEECTCTVEPD